MLIYSINFFESKPPFYSKERSEKSLISLPSEILEVIFSHLAIEETGAFARTCSICANETFILPKWQALALRILSKKIKCPVFTKLEEASLFIQNQRVQLRKMQAKMVPFNFHAHEANKIALVESLWNLLKEDKIKALTDSEIKSGLVKRSSGQWSLCRFKEKKYLLINALGEYKEGNRKDSNPGDALILGPLSYKVLFGPYSKLINTEDLYILPKNQHQEVREVLHKKYPIEGSVFFTKELAKAIAYSKTI